MSTLAQRVAAIRDERDRLARENAALIKHLQQVKKDIQRRKSTTARAQARAVEDTIRQSPGAKAPSVDRLKVLDSRIHRCELCGDWAWDTRLCKHCTKYGYPVIEGDMEVAA